METLEEKITRVLKDEIKLTAPKDEWAQRYEAEKEHLLKTFESGFITRIEHYGSTAIKTIYAKDIVDIMVFVRSLDEAYEIMPNKLTEPTYDYFKRPLGNENIPPYYAWFIKRGGNGERTHHIHVIEKGFWQLERNLLFRDYLIEHQSIAKKYEAVKLECERNHAGDRIAYTEAKGMFISETTEKAIKYYNEKK